MGERYLLDTNAVLDFINQTLPSSGSSFIGEILDSDPIISVVSKIELLGFTDVSTEVKTFVDFANVIPLVDKVVIATIDLRKKYKIKLPDAIIAATAIGYNLTLVTRNIADFQRIESIKIINPHTFAG